MPPSGQYSARNGGVNRLAPRKTPYRHKVRSHLRDGVGVSSYVRGDGEKPSQPKAPKTPGKGKAKYNVSFFFDGSRETYNVASGSLTAAIKEAIPRIQRPQIPQRAQIRRIKR